MPQTRARTTDPGWIYLIRRSSDGAVKIGRSTNPFYRLCALRTADPTLMLLGSVYVQNMYIEESRSHDSFRSTHVELEWFLLTPDQVSWFLSSWNNFSRKCKFGDSAPKYLLAGQVTPQEYESVVAVSGRPKKIPVLAKAVRDLRIAAGISQEKLGRVLDLTQVAIFKYERGSIPTFENLRKLAVVARQYSREDLADLFLHPVREEFQSAIDAMNGSRGVAA